MTGMMEPSNAKQPRIGFVDNWHPNWNRVRNSVAQQARGAPSLVQSDGWLPARENLLVAFMDDDVVVGHLCFRVEPEPVRRDGRPGCVSAEVDSFGVDPAYESMGIAQVLRDAGRTRARELNCGQLRGFDAVS